MANPPAAGQSGNDPFSPKITPVAGIGEKINAAVPVLLKNMGGRTHVDDVDELDDATKQLLGIGMTARERRAFSQP